MGKWGQRKKGQAPFAGTARRVPRPRKGACPLSLREKRIGLIAGILYATMILPTALAQAASHDVAPAPWINLTLLLLWQSHRARPAVPGGLSAGGGGGVGLVDPYEGTGRRGRGRRRLRRLPSTGIALEKSARR